MLNAAGKCLSPPKSQGVDAKARAPACREGPEPLTRDEASKRLAAAVVGVPLERRSEAADAMLRCVDASRADFTHLEAEFIPCLAHLGTEALHVLAGYSAGQSPAFKDAGELSSFLLPFGVGDVPGYDPAALAAALHEAVPGLRELTLPAPAGAKATLDLTALQQWPRPRIHILRASMSVLTVLLAQGTPLPDSSVGRFEDDSLALLPSWCYWFATDAGEERIPDGRRDAKAAAAKEKLPGAYYHHRQVKTGDEEEIMRRQLQAVRSSLIGAARFDDGSAIECSHFSMHIAKAWVMDDNARRDGKVAERARSEHPALKGLDSVEGIAATISSATQPESRELRINGRKKPFSAGTFGKDLAEIARRTPHGQESIVHLACPGGADGVAGHQLTVRVRVKGTPDAPTISIRLFDAKRQMTWGRGVEMDLHRLGRTELRHWIDTQTIKSYLGDGPQLGVIMEDPSTPEPAPGTWNNHVPVALRATPQYLFVGAFCRDPEMVREALDVLLPQAALHPEPAVQLAARHMKVSMLEYTAAVGDARVMAEVVPRILQSDLPDFTKIELLSPAIFRAIRSGQSAYVGEFMKLLSEHATPELATQVLSNPAALAAVRESRLFGAGVAGPASCDALIRYMKAVLLDPRMSDAQKVRACACDVFARGSTTPAAAAICAVIEAFPHGVQRNAWLQKFGFAQVSEEIESTGLHLRIAWAIAQSAPVPSAARPAAEQDKKGRPAPAEKNWSGVREAIRAGDVDSATAFVKSYFATAPDEALADLFLEHDAMAAICRDKDLFASDSEGAASRLRALQAVMREVLLLPEEFDAWKPIACGQGRGACAAAREAALHAVKEAFGDDQAVVARWAKALRIPDIEQSIFAASIDDKRPASGHEPHAVAYRGIVDGDVEQVNCFVERFLAENRDLTQEEFQGAFWEEFMQTAEDRWSMARLCADSRLFAPDAPGLAQRVEALQALVAKLLAIGVDGLRKTAACAPGPDALPAARQAVALAIDQAFPSEQERLQWRDLLSIGSPA